MIDVICLLAALLAAKALIWVTLVSFGYWLGFTDFFDE